MSKTLRILALTLAMIMIIATLSGCGGGSTASDNKSEPADTSSAETKTETKAESKPEAAAEKSGSTLQMSEPGTFPIVSEPVTLKAVVATGPFVEDMATNNFTKWYEEKTGVHIEWNTISEQGMAD